MKGRRGNCGGPRLLCPYYRNSVPRFGQCFIITHNTRGWNVITDSFSLFPLPASVSACKTLSSYPGRRFGLYVMGTFFLSLSRMPTIGRGGLTNVNGITFSTRSQNGVNLRPIFGVWGLSRNVPYGRQGLEGPAYITGRAKINARSFRCSEGQNWGKAGPFPPCAPIFLPAVKC